MQRSREWCSEVVEVLGYYSYIRNTTLKIVLVVGKLQAAKFGKSRGAWAFEARGFREPGLSAAGIFFLGGGPYNHYLY